MGLDNIPHSYPCKTQGTAVLTEDDRINCDATQECGGCPWKNDLGELGGAVYGIMGTNCWYRGKFGNAVLRENLGIDTDDTLNFYGDNEDGTYKSPESCLELAEAIEEAVAEDGVSPHGFDNEDDAKLYVAYMVAWLKWVAEKCEGSDAWY